jgi:hypothetical protein
VAATGSNPLLDGVKYQDLSAAQDAVGVPLLRPQDPLASDDQIKELWVRVESVGPTVRIDYASGVWAQMQPVGEEMTKPGGALAAFESWAKEAAYSTDGQARVVTIDDGSPAFLGPDGSARFANGASQNRPGEIDVVIGDFMVVIVGHVSNEELSRLASSIKEPPSDSG